MLEKRKFRVSQSLWGLSDERRRKLPLHREIQPPCPSSLI